MIFCKKTELEQYLGLGEHLDRAIQYLQTADLRELVMGCNRIDGENVYINRFDYTTIPPEESFFEAHLQYLDIHVLLSGEERIEVADIRALEEYDRDEAADFVGYHGEAQASFVMKPGDVLIVWPKDAHAVKLQLHGPAQVEKAVVKVHI